MKKISSVLLAFVMLCALCVPAFAGDAVDALTDPVAKAFCTKTVEYITANSETVDLTKTADWEKIAQEAAKLIPKSEINTEEKCTAVAAAAAEALIADYTLDEAVAQALPTIISTALANQYKADEDLGVDVIDPSDAVNNVIGSISDNDLSGLFNTLRNTITDLSGRLSGVFGKLGGGDSNGGDSSTGDDNSANSGSNGNYEGTEPTGDTAIYAVAGVAAAAAVVLVLTKKKF